MSRGSLDSLAAQSDLTAPDDQDDGYTGEVVNSWPSQKRWHELIAYTDDGGSENSQPTVTLTSRLRRCSQQNVKT
jgi:hypothetical protein